MVGESPIFTQKWGKAIWNMNDAFGRTVKRAKQKYAAVLNTGKYFASAKGACQKSYILGCNF